jgi:Protein of unknown function (DUF2852)
MWGFAMWICPLWPNGALAFMGRYERPSADETLEFAEYREETLRQLQQRKDAAGLLDQLRLAKDKAEFDQFMAEAGTHCLSEANFSA